MKPQSQGKLSLRQKRLLDLKIEKMEKGKPKLSKFKSKHPDKNTVGINSPFAGKEEK